MADLARSSSVGIQRSISQYDVPVHQMLPFYLCGHISYVSYLLAWAQWANHEKHLKKTLKIMACSGVPTR